MTKLEVANRALSLLTSSSITDLNDPLDEKARTISAIFDIAAREVMREHRWNCCIKRAELVQDDVSPEKIGNFGYSFSYTIPTDCIRFLDLNGEPYLPKSEFMDLNGRKLLTNAGQAHIRYVADMTSDEDVLMWDVAMASAVSVKIAMLVGRRITKDGMSYEDLYMLYQRELNTARKLDAMELGSGENRPLERLMGSSPLVNQGRRGGWSGSQMSGGGGSGGGGNGYSKSEADARFTQLVDTTNVDNTSDLDKPISNATQAEFDEFQEALDLKAGRDELNAAISSIDPSPTGSVAHYAATVPPQGWLKANGAIVNRSVYADLFAVIGETYGAGDGFATFALPDLRGEFVRSFDDGRGVDAGRVLGSAQQDEFGEHQHLLANYEQFDRASASPTPANKTLSRRRESGSDSNSYSLVGFDDPETHPADYGGSSLEGGVETRPRNIALLAIIKY